MRKIGLFNEGPGMSGDDLSRLMDMASTGKTLGTDDNFGQGGTYSYTPTKPGKIEYTCTLHPGMDGELTVTG